MDVRIDWTSGEDGSSHTVSDGTRLRVECGAVLAIESDTFISLREQEQMRASSLLIRQG
jgi:hypothetical protein